MKWNNPLDPVCITVDEVVEKKRPILLVYHEKGHGGWSFLDGFDTEGRKPVVVPKKNILSVDPSVESLTSMKVGYFASRADLDSDWTIAKIN